MKTAMALKSILLNSKEKSPPLECKLCKQRFWMTCKFIEHMSTHKHFLLTCNICNKCFSNQKNLDDHYLSHKEVTNTYDCSQCHRKFLQKHQLEQHMQFHTILSPRIEFHEKKRKIVHFTSVLESRNIKNNFSEVYDSSKDENPPSKAVKTKKSRSIKDNFSEDDYSSMDDNPPNKAVKTKKFRNKKNNFSEDIHFSIDENPRNKAVKTKKSRSIKNNFSESDDSPIDESPPKKVVKTKKSRNMRDKFSEDDDYSMDDNLPSKAVKNKKLRNKKNNFSEDEVSSIDENPPNKTVITRSGRIVKVRNVYGSEDSDSDYGEDCDYDYGEDSDYDYGEDSDYEDGNHPVESSISQSRHTIKRKKIFENEIETKRTRENRDESLDRARNNEQHVVVKTANKLNVVGKKLSNASIYATNSIGPPQNTVYKTLSVVIEKIPESMYRKYVEGGNISSYDISKNLTTARKSINGNLLVKPLKDRLSNGNKDMSQSTSVLLHSDKLKVCKNSIQNKIVGKRLNVPSRIKNLLSSVKSNVESSNIVLVVSGNQATANERINDDSVVKPLNDKSSNGKKEISKSTSVMKHSDGPKICENSVQDKIVDKQLNVPSRSINLLSPGKLKVGNNLLSPGKSKVDNSYNVPLDFENPVTVSESINGDSVVTPLNDRSSNENKDLSKNISKVHSSNNVVSAKLDHVKNILHNPPSKSCSKNSNAKTLSSNLHASAKQTQNCNSQVNNKKTVSEKPSLMSSTHIQINIPNSNRINQEFLYVGPVQDVLKIRSIIEEVKTVANKNVNSKSSLPANSPQNVGKLNKAGSLSSGKSASNKKNNSSKNVNKSGNKDVSLIESEDGILEKKFVDDFLLVKVTPELMQKMQQRKVLESKQIKTSSVESPNIEKKETVSAGSKTQKNNLETKKNNSHTGSVPTELSLTTSETNITCDTVKKNMQINQDSKHLQTKPVIEDMPDSAIRNEKSVEKRAELNNLNEKECAKFESKKSQLTTSPVISERILPHLKEKNAEKEKYKFMTGEKIETVRKKDCYRIQISSDASAKISESKVACENVKTSNQTNYTLRNLKTKPAKELTSITTVTGNNKMCEEKGTLMQEVKFVSILKNKGKGVEQKILPVTEVVDMNVDEGNVKKVELKTELLNSPNGKHSNIVCKKSPNEISFTSPEIKEITLHHIKGEIEEKECKNKESYKTKTAGKHYQKSQISPESLFISKTIDICEDVTDFQTNYSLTQRKVRSQEIELAGAESCSPGNDKTVSPQKSSVTRGLNRGSKSASLVNKSTGKIKETKAKNVGTSQISPRVSAKISEEKDATNHSSKNKLNNFLCKKDIKHETSASQLVTSAVISEKILKRFKEKLEEKERKKKEKYELKKRMRHLEKYHINSPNLSFSAEKVSLKLTSNKDKNRSLKLKDIKVVGNDEHSNHSLAKNEASTHTHLSSSKKVEDSPKKGGVVNAQHTVRFSPKSQAQHEKLKSKQSKSSDEEAIQKAYEVSLKFQKTLREKECLKLLHELDNLITNFNISKKCPFLFTIIRFCRLYVDSYKVKEKAISLHTKLTKHLLE